MGPSEFQRKTIWVAATAVAIVIIGAIFVGLIWLGGNILGYLQPVLVPLAVAGIIAYLLEPLVARLEKHKQITRLRSVLIVPRGFSHHRCHFRNLRWRRDRQPSQQTRQRRKTSAPNSSTNSKKFKTPSKPAPSSTISPPIRKRESPTKTPEDERFHKRPYPAREKREEDGKVRTHLGQSRRGENHLSKRRTRYPTPKQASASSQTKKSAPLSSSKKRPPNSTSATSASAS